MANFFDNLREVVNYFNANKDYYEGVLRNQAEAEAQPLDVNERIASILGDYRGWTPQETSMDPEKDVEWKSHQGRPYETQTLGKFAPADATYTDDSTTEALFYWKDPQGYTRGGRLIIPIEDALDTEGDTTRVYGAILDDGTRLNYNGVKKLFLENDKKMGNSARNPITFYKHSSVYDRDNTFYARPRSAMNEAEEQKTMADLTAQNRELLDEYRKNKWRTIDKKQPLPRIFLDNPMEYYK